MKTKQELHQLVKDLALQGKNVIVDTTLGIFDHDEVFDFWLAMDGIFVLSVLVYCPFTELLEHIICRNYSGQHDQERNIKNILSQFCSLYILARSSNCMIDTLTKQEVVDGLQIARQELSLTKSEDAVEQTISKLAKKYEHAFSLSTHDRVGIASQYCYDLLVNTAQYNADECAKQIVRACVKKITK